MKAVQVYEGDGVADTDRLPPVDPWTLLLNGVTQVDKMAKEVTISFEGNITSAQWFRRLARVVDQRITLRFDYPAAGKPFGYRGVVKDVRKGHFSRVLVEFHSVEQV